jgi:hypothetical protein
MSKAARKERICIIGAGSAGLSAACYLQEKGFKHITILERDNHPGGKCCSFNYKGRMYELGAIIGIDDYDATLKIMDRVGIKPTRFSKMSKKTVAPKDLTARGYYSLNDVFPGYISAKEAVPLLWQIFKYITFLSRKYQNLYRPGLSNLRHELYETFETWMNRNSMKLFWKMGQIPFTTFGYGYAEEVPAAYVLKYFDVPTVKSLVDSRKFFKWVEGVQTIWERVAKDFDVRYSCTIKNIRRGGIITIETETETIECDRIIITGPLDEALNYLEKPTKEEKDLFSKIRYYDYYVYTCFADGLRIKGGIRPENFGRNRKGYPMIWDCKWKDDNLYTIYVMGDEKNGDKEIRKRIEEEFAVIGGTVTGYHEIRRWKYFPHVDSATMKSGYYEKLEAIQGKNNTFLSGEVLSFSTVEHSVRYSRQLVERFFS